MTSSSHRDILPINAIRADFETAFEAGPVVITSPTGSGKSTVVPVWCAELGHRVLVVEPRRVACRSLARYVGAGTGWAANSVGHWVRHDAQGSRADRIVFATPGIALGVLGEGGARGFDCIVVDEVHERSADVDLLLALCRRFGLRRVVAMSATADADRLGAFLSGRVLSAEGRQYPVDVRYVGGSRLPTARGLTDRVVDAVSEAWSASGDILVFLPGRREISDAEVALRRDRRLDAEIVPLHGSLPAEAQDRVFAPGAKRRVILSTNVAETSVTLPRIGVVVDSGLVRRTRYHRGDSVLGLAAVATDSAEQRAGRAGRLGPGQCLRMWEAAGQLDERTPPEVQREVLTSVVLRCAEFGLRPEQLDWLDAPAPWSLRDARSELERCGAMGRDGRLTPIGTKMAQLPVDPGLARLLVEAEQLGCLEGACDLVGAIDAPGALLRSRPTPEQEIRRLELAGAARCEATLWVELVRQGDVQEHGVHAATLAEARRVSAQLRSMMGCSPLRRESEKPLDRLDLASAWAASDPSSVYVRRRKNPSFTNDGAEARLSASTLIAETVEVIVAALRRTVEGRVGRPEVRVECALVADMGWLRRTGLGRWRVAQPRWEKDARGRHVVCSMSRQFAWKELETVDREPEGPDAVEALAILVECGQWKGASVDRIRQRLDAQALWSAVREQTMVPDVAVGDWIRGRLAELGVEHGRDAALLSADDLLPPALGAEDQAWLDQHFPRAIHLGNSAYAVEYDMPTRTVTLVKPPGGRAGRPSILHLPRWPSWRVLHRDKNVVTVLSERR